MHVPTFNYGPDAVRIDTVAVSRFLEHAAAIVDTARDVHERAHADYGPDAADIGTVTDVARSIVDRVALESERAPRRAHTFWHGDRVDGDRDPVTPAPEHYRRVVADTVTERTNSGVTVARVTVHGRGYVGGDVHAAPSPALAMSSARLAHAIDTAPRTAMGHVDGIALARLTAAAYPDIPAMIGGDVLTWHERPTYDDTMARQTLRGWPVRYRLPTVHPRNGETVPDVTAGPDTAPYLLAPADTGTVDRRTVPAIVDRDDTGRVVAVRPSHTIVTTGPTRHAWRGHRLAERPDTVRATRARRARRVDAAFTVPESAVLADVLAGIAATAETAPYRATWTHRGESGAVTVSGTADRPRYSVTGLPRPVRNYLTPRGLRTAVERATA